ncbi:hypothetical protein ACSXAY_19015 (plasmid) [Clostridium perfringens]
MKFIDKRTGKINEAYSISEIKGKVKIKFSESGKDYWYLKDNVDIIEKNQLIIYSFNKKCFKCGNNTKIYTYIIYDNTTESLKFPWDKKRLNNLKTSEQSFLHIEYEKIEFYPIGVIGSNENLDNILLKEYPKSIKKLYSATQKRKYPMNVCEECGAKQGEFFLYEDINKFIKDMKEINIEKTVEI